MSPPAKPERKSKLIPASVKGPFIMLGNGTTVLALNLDEKIKTVEIVNIGSSRIQATVEHDQETGVITVNIHHVL